MMNWVELDSTDRNLDHDSVNIRHVHWSKFDMIDNHGYVYNNVHPHSNDVWSQHDVDVRLMMWELDSMMNGSAHDDW